MDALRRLTSVVDIAVRRPGTTHVWYWTSIGSGPLYDFQCNFVAATALNSFLDAHLVPDEATPYRRQYYLLHDA